MNICNFIIYVIVHRHLGCSQLGVIINKAAMNSLSSLLQIYAAMWGRYSIFTLTSFPKWFYHFNSH